MKQVIPRRDANRYDAQMIEAPYFAKIEVERALNNPLGIRGLVDLLSAHHIPVSDCRLEHHKRRIVESIERGDWLVVSDKPFVPLSVKDLKVGAELSPKRLAVDMQTSLARKIALAKGPGKWVKRDIQYDRAANAVALVANRIASLGDEGRVAGSDGKDYANTTRTMIQEWTPLMVGESHLAERSIQRSYGELRRIKQRYFEGSDNWQVTGSSWHWQPVTADVEFELKGGSNGN